MFTVVQCLFVRRYIASIHRLVDKTKHSPSQPLKFSVGDVTFLSFMLLGGTNDGEQSLLVLCDFRPDAYRTSYVPTEPRYLTLPIG